MDCSDSPTNLLRTSLGPIDMNAACASPETAFANCVLPVPGGPYKRIDAGAALTPCKIKKDMSYYKSIERNNNIEALDIPVNTDCANDGGNAKGNNISSSLSFA